MSEKNKFNIKVKICLVGDASVGKTSLIRRYVLDLFDDKYIDTLGTKVSKKRVIFKKDGREINLTLSIWDVLGQEDFKNIQSMAFRGSKGAMLVCDITRKNTFDNLVTWHSRVKEVAGNIPFILLANKCDLNDQYTFNEETLKEFASKINAPYYLTSAKIGDNVIKTFYNIGDTITMKIFENNK